MGINSISPTVVVARPTDRGVAEKRNIADNTWAVRIRVRAGVLERVFVFRREFDARHDPAMISDIRGSASIVFGPFFSGDDSTNPVNTQTFFLHNYFSSQSKFQ